MTSDSLCQPLHLQSQLDAMPPVAAMQVRVGAFDGVRLCLAAPLSANVNDKGCAFGGSLSGLMTLAGWGLLTLRLAEAGHAAEVFVADSQVRYLAPLFQDLLAEAVFAEGQDWAGFLATFTERGRARASLTAAISDGSGKRVAELSGRFVAFRPTPSDRPLAQADAQPRSPCIMPV